MFVCFADCRAYFLVAAALVLSFPPSAVGFYLAGSDGLPAESRLPADNNDEAKKGLALLEGVWKFASVEVEGKKQAGLPFETNKMVLGRDGRTIIVQGPRITRGSLKVDPAQTPKHYDTTVPQGPGKTQQIPGIYELERDTLKVCMPLRDPVRPTELASKPDSGHILFVFERQTKDIADTLLAVARQELEGTWQAVSYVVNGEKASDEEMKRIKLQFDGEGQTTGLRDGQVFVSATTKIDPGKNPLAIDITYTAGDPKGKKLLGIYKVEGDLLTICRSAPDKPRPSEFVSQPGSGLTLTTFKREAPVKK